MNIGLFCRWISRWYQSVNLYLSLLTFVCCFGNTMEASISLSVSPFLSSCYLPVTSQEMDFHFIAPCSLQTIPKMLKLAFNTLFHWDSAVLSDLAFHRSSSHMLQSRQTLFIVLCACLAVNHLSKILFILFPHAQICIRLSAMSLRKLKILQVPFSSS